jgi:hypothetical protein
VVEHYVKQVLSPNHRSVLDKCRCGGAPIIHDTGRYDGLAVEDSTCFNCTNKVEDEVHVLLQCPLFETIRHSMVHEARAITVACAT